MTLDPIDAYASVADNNPDYIDRWKFGNSITLVNNSVDPKFNNITLTTTDYNYWSGYVPYNGGYVEVSIYYTDYIGDYNRASFGYLVDFIEYPSNQNCPSYITKSIFSSYIPEFRNVTRLYNTPYNYFPKKQWELYNRPTATDARGCIYNVGTPSYVPEAVPSLTFSFPAPSSKIRDYSIKVKKIKPRDDYSPASKAFVNL